VCVCVCVCQPVSELREYLCGSAEIQPVERQPRSPEITGTATKRAGQRSPRGAFLLLLPSARPSIKGRKEGGGGHIIPGVVMM